MNNSGGVDWDGDGDVDLVCGNSAGYIGLIENLGIDPRVTGQDNPMPKFSAPKYLEADGRPIRIMAGANGFDTRSMRVKMGLHNALCG